MSSAIDNLSCIRRLASGETGKTMAGVAVKIYNDRWYLLLNEGQPATNSVLATGYD
jgi:hypothetical protein